jgi:maltooligosyltrehalose trehalohydrolase
VPDPQARETFERSRLDFDEIAKPEHSAMLELYRRLIQLRRGYSELSTPNVTARFDERTGFFALDRPASVVAVNLGREPLRVPLSRDEGVRAAEVLLATDGATLEDSSLVLPGESLLVATLSGGSGVRR